MIWNSRSGKNSLYFGVFFFDLSWRINAYNYFKIENIPVLRKGLQSIYFFFLSSLPWKMSSFVSATEKMTIRTILTILSVLVFILITVQTAHSNGIYGNINSGF